jgi:phosphoribosylformylglycinamidine cyclo-ligase
VLPDDFSAELDLDADRAAAGVLWLAKTGGVRRLEMMRTFNCGIGMVPRRDNTPGAGVIYRGSISL